MTDLFDGFFAAGFECSAHRLPDGRRVDCLAATGHDRWADADYAALVRAGLHGARDGLRWHLIEREPGQYDWSSAAPLVQAARRHGVQVIWDLCHYGWPDDLDIWSEAFVVRFARFAAAAARFLRREGGAPPTLCVINEPSYWAWAGGDQGLMNPLARERGGDLKRQLVRATMAAIDAVRAIEPHARFLSAEPGIHVAPRHPDEASRAVASSDSQFEAMDLLTGRVAPELGGDPRYLDIVGINFYPDNQWFLDGGTIPAGSHAYRPLRALLAELFERYGRPLMIAETGAEGSARASWLHYVCGEVQAAMDDGVPVLALCLYPILDYPGWTDERLCDVGLFGVDVDSDGRRRVHQVLAAELSRQQAIMRDRLGADRVGSGRDHRPADRPAA